MERNIPSQETLMYMGLSPSPPITGEISHLSNGLDVADDALGAVLQVSCNNATARGLERCGMSSQGARSLASYSSVSVPILTKTAMAVATGREANPVGDTLETAASLAVGVILDKTNYLGVGRLINASKEQKDFMAGVAIATVAGQVAGKPLGYSLASAVLSGGIQAAMEGNLGKILPKRFTDSVSRSDSHVQNLHRQDSQSSGLSIV